MTLEPGLYTLEGWVKTRDVGAADPAQRRAPLPGRAPAANWWQCTEVARGTADWTPLRVAGIPVRERGSYKVWLGAYGTPGWNGVVREPAPDRGQQAATRRLPALSELPRDALRRPLADRARGRRGGGAQRAACGCRWWTRLGPGPREPRVLAVAGSPAELDAARCRPVAIC